MSIHAFHEMDLSRQKSMCGCLNLQVLKFQDCEAFIEQCLSKNKQGYTFMYDVDVLTIYSIAYLQLH